MNHKTTTFEEALEQYGHIVFTNVGVSMKPLLRQGRDLMEIKKKEPGRCKKYDVVLYKRGARYILHRIIKVTPDGYVIAGDHNYFREYDITDEKIIGVLTGVVREGGKRIDVNDRNYKFYVHLWCDFYYIRAAILFVKSIIYRAWRRVKKLLQKK